MAADDAFLDKAIEGLVLYAFNKGETGVCSSPAIPARSGSSDPDPSWRPIARAPRVAAHLAATTTPAPVMVRTTRPGSPA